MGDRYETVLDIIRDRDKLRAEVGRLRRLADLVRVRCRAAHPQWAPELREALAALSEGEKP